MDTRRQLRLPVYGLGGGGAGATTIERVLAATDGRAAVDRGTETVHVDDDPAETDERTLARAIERAGDRAGRPTEA